MLGRDVTLRPPRRAEVVSGVVLLAILFSLWLFVGITRTRAELNGAAASAASLRNALVSGNAQQATAALDDVQHATRQARDRTHGPLWRAMGHVPWLGKNFSAVRTVSDTSDDIARRALPPVVKVATQIDLKSFAPRKGQLDLSRLTVLRQPVVTTDAVFASADRRLQTIDASSLLPGISGPVSTLQDAVSTGSAAADSIHKALDLLPTMVGGPKRTYLMIFQNNAEIRSTGGIPGSAVLVTTDHGKIALGRQGSGGGFGRLPAPALKLTSEEKALYGDNMAQYFVDANLTPDFPRTAQIAEAILRQRADIHVDGVLSFDPVAASYVLRGTGPVRLADGTILTSRNATDVLLNQAYLRISDPTKQDDYFESAARRLFSAFTSGRGDTRTAIKGLVRAGAEHRLYVYSNHADEQKVVARTPLGGVVSSAQTSTPHLGVFMNDSTGAKMEYYLASHVTVRPTSCTRAGSQYVQTFVDLHSRAPKDAANLPHSVLGEGYGTAPGSMRFNVRFYLPIGATLASATSGATDLPLQTQPYKGHRVYTLPVDLKPDQTVRLALAFRTAVGQPDDVQVSRTPGAQAGDGLTVEPTQCSG